MSGKVREIAKRSQVSIATVSRVLHQSEQVRPETRRKVIQTMDEMGIQPEELVRGAKKDAGVIGVVVPDIRNPFFSDIILGMEPLARKMGLGIFICHTMEDDQTEVQCLRLLKEAHVRGIIITPVSDDSDHMNNEYVSLLRSMKIPIVLVDRDVKYANYDGVFIDNECGAYEATKLLLENGHENIVLIGGPLNTEPGRGREKGYRDAHLAMKVPVKEKLVYRGDFSLACGKKITEEVLKTHPEATAIFTANNLMTIGCLTVLHENGLQVPDDISVVGFDDVDILDMLGFRITTVDRHTSEMGRRAMLLLSRSIDGKQSRFAQRITLAPKLILRGSEKRVKKQSLSI